MSTVPHNPRVCFVLPSLAPGGTERQLLYLLEGLAGSHACSVVCTRTAGVWANQARALGAQVFALDTRGGWDFRIGGRIRALFHTVRPQIVQTFLYGFDLPVNRAARATGARVVISTRRELAEWMRPRHIRAQRRANEFVDCIVANCRAVADFASQQEGLETQYMRVIHNGLDVSTFAPAPNEDPPRAHFGIPPGKRVVGMLANFSEVKDHDLFIAVAQLLLQRRGDIHFLLAGAGPERRRIEQAIQSGGMERSFTITSTTTGAPDLLRAMDVCVLTSRREGLPNALLEAMAARRPVVAAAVGGVPELVEDNRSGLLVHSRSPGEFALAIAKCLDDFPFARKLGQRAHSRVAQAFAATQMVGSYRALYAELMASAGCVEQCAASAE